MPYAADDATPGPDRDALRARVPGWGIDLDAADRPAFPREQPGIPTGAHWRLPEQQAHGETRERSVEHPRITPVFGTAQPLRGVSGAIRRLAYERYSEGQTPHWLLLILGDRVETAGSRARSLLSTRPDQPITQTGVLAESRRHPIRSRRSPGRVDLRHAWMDPLLVAGPWLLAAGALVGVGRAVARRR
ncbi:hypothetical protein GCM10009846_30580 [Agrococcus versicolor]|uniref:Uncharacterized protein n=1 Tax=Agrococcus versicolor TaxID=501482 RepID=A0ABN3AZC8_9MICO